MKKSFWWLLAIMVLLPIIAVACTGPAGSQGQPGLPGLPGLQGPQGLPGKDAPGLPGASLVVTPSEVALNGKVTITGAGFTPQASVVVDIIQLFAPSDITVSPTDLKANDAGAFQFTYDVNKDSIVGLKTIQARDSKGTVATTPITIVK